MNFLTAQAKLGLLLITSFLTACGDGGGSDSNISSEQPKSNQVNYGEISGTAFSNSVLNSAQVTALCKNGSGFKSSVNTNDKGEWKGEVDKNQFPCRIEINTNTQQYHGYAVKEGNVNLNPLTDLIIANATAQLPSVWYKTGNIIDEGKLKSSTDALIKELKNKGYSIDESRDILNSISNVTTQEFQIINDLYSAIEGSKTLEDINTLLLLVKDGNLIQIPEKIKIPDITSTVWNINLAACTNVSDSFSIGYIKCSQELLKDFEENNLVAQDSNENCQVKKQNELITLIKGTKSLTVKLDKEEQDGVTIQEEGNFYLEGPMYDVVANTGIYDMNYQFTQGILQFSKTGQLTVAYFKSPDQEIRCFNPEVKKIFVDNNAI